VQRIFRAANALGFRPYRYFSIVSRVLVAVMLTGTILSVPATSLAATLSTASVALSDPTPSQTNVNYTMTMSGVSAVALRCITETYVTTPSGVTAVPGFNAAAATVNGASTLLNASTGSWAVADTANTITYTNATNATAPSTTSGATFIAQAITNGNTGNTSYWLQFKTYSNAACTTPVDNVTVGFIYNAGSTLSLTVDPTLTFTVAAVASGQVCNGPTSTAPSTATTIPFGFVTSAANAIVCQDLTASTNATNGYTIYTRYTSAPTNAIAQTIADWTGTNAAPTLFTSAGTEAYGYNTNAAALGTGTAGRFTANKFAAMTTSNLEVGYSAVGVNATTYRIGHQVAISTLTKPGTYTTTVIYTCTPIF
jgi:hypothetical protein